ncbi:MAG: ABC transporter ATP-binding protein [Clostridia bacterium]|nr:ABC transporter ATP-binding protein [Clostridia bacterium]
MLKLLKNLKKSFWSVIVIVVLLCVQAQADLALPDYTSKIVNIGIQAGGIETAVPEVIDKDNMELLLMFSDKKEEIVSNYSLLGDNLNEKEKKIIKKYLGKDEKKIEPNTIYVLNQIENDKKQELASILSVPLMEIATIKNEETANQIKEKMIANIPETQKTYIQNKSLLEIIKNMPEEQRKQALQQFSEKINNMADSIREQAAISSVKEIYKELGVDTNKLQNDYILLSGIQMLGVALITMISAVSIMFFSSRVAAYLGKTLREKVFAKVLQFGHKELREFSTASLITRTTNDIQQIQQLITMLFRVVVYAPIIGIGGFIKVLTNSDNSMAWIIGVAILAILFIVGTLFIIAMPKFKKLQELTDKLNLVSREILTGLPVIRAFHKEKKEEGRFNEANKDLMKANIFVNNAMSTMMPLLMFVMNAMMLLVIWVGGHGVEEGLLQVGDMMAFIQYMMQIVMAFLMISMISIMLPRASVSANRINEVLETKPSIEDKEVTKKLNAEKKGLVEFKNVSFRYPDADTEILEDINFTAKPGETTAIIGSTGSGKSTVVNLLPRFYDVTGGELLIDGVNVKEVAQKELRDIIGFVPQKGILFSGTIESNIKYADENMTDERMIEAAKIAQATEFIEGKEKKYQDEIAQGGSNVSGGQKQRLAISRAIAKDPEIFVFDDSFSALDFKTDSALREALSQKTENKTVIIVAQRISTILNADQIVVLEEGKVVGIGTHEELMKNNETYRQIALSQLSEEELSSEAKQEKQKNQEGKEA